ncbi:MAG: uncharacterized protein QOH06_2486 [Acidobacteriota bacterium]|jgi:putative component of membrane protein insertase Oxa1/YidC/SpoIIIJ protein YidD|nr:uncharacterized protein [Acidobacteriota bacterium]
MKLLLLLGIRLYWRLWPEQLRRSCLFRESCSRYVYRVTAHAGASAGFAAFLERARRCRGGYSVETLTERLVVRLVDGSALSETEASPSLLLPYWSAAQQRQQEIAHSCSHVTLGEQP